MNVELSRDVVLDLLPLYAAGEASEATRRLVEECLAADPELAEAARRMQMPPEATPALSPDREAAALGRTRELLRRRSQLMAVAILFTALPLSFGFSDGRVTFLLVRDAPVVAGAWWATAAVLWGLWWRTRRQLPDL